MSWKPSVEQSRLTAMALGLLWVALIVQIGWTIFNASRPIGALARPSTTDASLLSVDSLIASIREPVVPVEPLSRARRSGNARVKLVEPGYGPTTRFTSNGGARMEGLFPEAYAAFARPILESLSQVTTVTTESDVAETIYRAATDTSGQLRFPAGPDAVALARAALGRLA